MPRVPLWVHLVALAVLLLLSAFFSITETAMMAINRLRLRHLVRQGNAAARRTQTLLDRTDRLLSVLLIGNNLANTAATALVAALSIYDLGDQQWGLAAATVLIAFLILVFSEITPKIIGATYPEPIALAASFVLRPILWIATPAVWFVNLFVHLILRVLRLARTQNMLETHPVTPEELRTLVLEGSNFIPGKHRSMLLNVFDLEALSVDDVMTPRPSIEGIDLDQPFEAVLDQLTTCYHNKLPVFEGDISRVVGILHVRKLLPVLAEGKPEVEAMRQLLVDPYWIPTGTSLLQQLQMFQDNRQRLGLVVDEYGDLLGLVTVDDIVEEIVGEFTTQAPGTSASSLRWGTNGQVIVDGTVSLRLLNRRLALALPLDGPKTLNGLLLERLEQIPDGPCCLQLPGCNIEVVQILDQAVRSVRLIRVPAIPGQ
ncbi:Mg2+/Co2+ transporter transmembrane protein [Burkholderiales bacterium]|jgi:Mg2+/Co2+ transporter CorB|nr:Mg2+/Co2+ transporter transmembrane protein [Burkholderiales bacterium]